MFCWEKNNERDVVCIQYIFDITSDEDRIAVCLEQDDTAGNHDIRRQNIGFYIMKVSSRDCFYAYLMRRGPVEHS